MRRKNFVLAGLILGILGFFAILLVLISSLRPSARSDADLPRVPTSSIPKGGYIYIADIYESDNFPAEILMIRMLDGKLHAWFIPFKEGVHRLPDGPWWRPGLPCFKFRPDFILGQIRCHDENLPQWAKESFLWSLDGKGISKNSHDMISIPSVEEEGFFVFHKTTSKTSQNN